MDSEDSRDGSGDVHSSSSSSSSSSRSRRSSSSDRSESSKKDVKSKPPGSPPSPRSEGPRSPSPRSEGPRSPSPRSEGPRSPSPRSEGPRSPSPRSEGPRSPSPESHSQSPIQPSIAKPPQSPDNLSEAHSDINSPENSMPGSPAGPKSPDAPKSPSEAGSNIGSPEQVEHYSSAPSGREGPKTPQSPGSSIKSNPGSPERSQSPDSVSQANSPSRNIGKDSRTSSPSPERNSFRSSPARSPTRKKNDWSPKENWRRHTKAEQKMVPISRNRSRSESSQSSRSSTYNKRGQKDPATEEISEGEMESDQEDKKSKSKTNSGKSDKKDLNITHEDLSDVSDLDSMGPDENEKEVKPESPASPVNKPEPSVNGTTQSSPKSDCGQPETPKLEKVPQEKTSNTEDGEEQLDFEAEEGECIDHKSVEQSNGDADEKTSEKVEDVKPGKRSRGSSLEEGEVSDEGERRPEESEPRPVCRFFSRGACTWGISCRFLHPGVTDKGNYNMFDVVRGVPPSGAYPPAPAARDAAAAPESAWERGLRTAKEMLRIANKRKEQDMDFEEKKLHLSVGGVVHDPDAELAYAAAAVGASPPRLDPDLHRTYGPMYRGRGPRPPFDERERYFEREMVYERERAYDRPPHYDERAPPPEEMAYHKRRVRSSREVIVQRPEVERREAREVRDARDVRDVRDMRDMRDVRDVREARRGDDWADPWMRAEPAARRRKPPSSDDSYSSSRLSPSVIVRERRLATARATAMNPPAPRGRRAPSPAASRQLAANPPAPADHRHKDEMDPYGRNKDRRDRKKYSRSSSSGSESSSSSSESESESHSSSTSGSSGARRARHARLLNAAARPRLNAKSSAAGLAAAVAISNKKETDPGSKKRSATSPVDSGPSKKSVSRREELLKQLKAVEDAIARKRSKI